MGARAGLMSIRFSFRPVMWRAHLASAPTHMATSTSLEAEPPRAAATRYLIGWSARALTTAIRGAQWMTFNRAAEPRGVGLQRPPLATSTWPAPPSMRRELLTGSFARIPLVLKLGQRLMTTNTFPAPRPNPIPWQQMLRAICLLAALGGTARSHCGS